MLQIIRKCSHSVLRSYKKDFLTADGTLYGVSSDYEMKKLASDVKQTGMGHYLTNKGEVKEINSGKTIAADCKAFAEHRYGRVIGVLKNDGSFSMGYTYLGGRNIMKRVLYMQKRIMLQQLFQVVSALKTKHSTAG